MYFQFDCPSCHKSLKVREENAGNKVRCPYCQTTLTIKSPQSTGASGDEMTPSDSHVLSEGPSSEIFGDASSWSSSGTEVSMMRSGVYAAVATLVFFGIVYPFRDFLGSIGHFFLERGWVPYILVFFGFWSAAILYLKSKKLAKQKDSMLFDLLPGQIAEDITARTAPQFIQHIRGLPTNPNESFLINRVLRGLEHFRNLQSSAEVADRLQSQSEIDATAVESSYTSLKVFIWAIPILGFIGTVMGIGEAVAGLSGGQKDAILTTIAAGLATAFDTTLLALVMSLLVMFPTSSMQKSEEDLLNLVDEYCNENFLKRLKDGGRAATAVSGNSSRSIEKAVDAAMADYHADLRNWTKSLDTNFTAMRDGLTSLNAVLEKLGDKLGAGELRDVAGHASERVEGLNGKDSVANESPPVATRE